MVKEKTCCFCGELLPRTTLGQVCASCYPDYEWVSRRIRYARSKGVAADLTVTQWKNTVNHFNDKCAYCQKASWDLLEHFIPTALGGATTVSNVVPACNSCNRRKYNLHPDQVTSIRKSDIDRVRSFLNQQISIKNCS
jgi:5-methylcytosine-specific restriction endonuclease McrA